MNLITLKPFSSEKDDPLREVRALCRELFPAKPQNVLRRIAAVGAIYSPQRGLYVSDEGYLTYAVRRMAQMGVPVAPDFEYTPINFYEDPERGKKCDMSRDFLSPDFKIETDLLLSCAVFKPLFFSLRLMPSFCKEPICAVSPYQADPDAWRKAAERCGASVIMTVEDGSTVNASDFVSETYPFVRLAESESHHFYNIKYVVERSFAARAAIEVVTPQPKGETARPLHKSPLVPLMAPDLLEARMAEKMAQLLDKPFIRDFFKKTL